MRVSSPVDDTNGVTAVINRLIRLLPNGIGCSNGVPMKNLLLVGGDFNGDGVCYTLHCTTTSGGCGAEMPGDSREEVITSWNRRVTESRIVI